MDQYLPVDPLAISGAWRPRPWRDTPQSPPIVITAPTLEPLSRAEAKQQSHVTGSEDDGWFDRALPAARRQVEKDTNRTFGRTVLEMVFDQFPIEPWLTLPQPPLVSVSAISSFDVVTGVESTFSSANYLVDTYSQPGRVCLVTGASWPTGVRLYLGGKVRWTAGYGAAPVSVTSITLGTTGTATVTTASAHGGTTGQRWTIGGADQEAYNGTFPITVTGATTFTYAVTGVEVSPATGTISAAVLNVPDRYVQAIALLLAHWYENREAVTSGDAKYVPELYPLGYDALLDDRVAYCG